MNTGSAQELEPIKPPLKPGAQERLVYRRSGSGEKPQFFSPARIYELLHRHSIFFLCTAALAIATAAAGHFLLPSFRANANLALQAAINNPLQSLSARLGGFSGFDVDGREADRYLVRLRIHQFYSRLALDVKNDPDLRDLTEDKFFRSKPLRNLINEVMGSHKTKAVHEIPDTELAARLEDMVVFSKDGIESVSVHTAAVSREVAYRLTNLAAKSAVASLVEYEVQDLNESDVYLKMQAEKTEDTIRETENEIASFKKKAKVFSMNTSFEESTSRSLEIKKELVQVQVAIDENEAEIKKLKERQKDYQSPEDETYKFSIKRKLEYMESQGAGLQAKRDSLEKLLQKLYNSYDENAEQQLMELRKKIDLQSSLFQELKKHDFQMEMRRISAKNKFRIMESARIGGVRRSESLMAKVLMALMASVVFSCLFAYSLEVAFPLVRSIGDLQRFGLVALGDVPNAAKRKRNPFILEEVVNSFLHIRARLLSLPWEDEQNRRGKIILVTSSEEGEGKTYTSRKLAVAIGEARHRVLLVDADLRSPSLSKQLGMLEKEGLTEVVDSRELFGKVKMSQIELGVDFLSAGKQHNNATKTIASKEFERLLLDFASIYDYVVVDTPPLCVASDPALISRIADIPLLVVASGHVYQQVLSQSLDKIQSFNNGPIYAILNKTALSQRYGYFLYGARKKYSSKRGSAESFSS